MAIHVKIAKHKDYLREYPELDVEPTSIDFENVSDAELHLFVELMKLGAIAIQAWTTDTVGGTK